MKVAWGYFTLLADQIATCVFIYENINNVRVLENENRGMQVFFKMKAMF